MESLGHTSCQGGAQTLRGSHPGFSLISSGPIFSLTPGRVVRSGCIIWDNFQAVQTSIASMVNFPDICSSCREYPRLHLPDLCMHVADSSRSSVYGYFLLFCVVFQRRSTLMRSSWWVVPIFPTCTLYFLLFSIIHAIELCWFLYFACIIYSAQTLIYMTHTCKITTHVKKVTKTHLQTPRVSDLRAETSVSVESI